MNLGVLDIISFGFSIAALLILVIYWKNQFCREAKVLLAAFLVFIAFRNFSNAMEWAFHHPELDPIEDFTESITPLLITFFLYAVIQNIIHKQLDRIKEQFMGTFEQAAVGIAHIGLNGTFLRVNKKICEITGYSEEEIKKKTFQEITHPDDLDRDVSLAKQLVQGDIETYFMEKRYFHKNEDVVWINLTVSIQRDDHGEPLYYIAVIEDISKRHAYECERKELMRKIEEKNKEMESIIYITSHDLRSPLVNIYGFGQILRESCGEIRKKIESITINEEDKAGINRILEKDIDESLHYIKAGTDKIQMLLDGLLKLSRLGRDELNMVHLDMNDMLEKIVHSMEFQISKIKAVVDVEQLESCHGDMNQINQVFSNLIDNAIKYRNPERECTIRISCESDDNAVIYCVEDNGVGIEEKHLERIFELFHRLDPENSEGEGLGLSYVKRILERHEGKILVESEEGIGSRFYVTLPKATV